MTTKQMVWVGILDLLKITWLNNYRIGKQFAVWLPRWYIHGEIPFVSNK